MKKLKKFDFLIFNQLEFFLKNLTNRTQNRTKIKNRLIFTQVVRKTKKNFAQFFISKDFKNPKIRIDFGLIGFNKLKWNREPQSIIFSREKDENGADVYVYNHLLHSKQVYMSTPITDNSKSLQDTKKEKDMIELFQEPDEENIEKQIEMRLSLPIVRTYAKMNEIKFTPVNSGFSLNPFSYFYPSKKHGTTEYDVENLALHVSKIRTHLTEENLPDSWKNKPDSPKPYKILKTITGKQKVLIHRYEELMPEHCYFNDKAFDHEYKLDKTSNKAHK